MSEDKPTGEPLVKKKERRPLTDALAGTSAGVDLVANILVGLGLGYLCERFLPWSSPWGFLGFLFLGIGSGFWQLFRTQGAGPKVKK